MLVDQFPELSETFIAAEAQELVRQGHSVHVESAWHAPHPNYDAARRLDVAYLEDDDRGRRLRDLGWLVARHPLRCARDLLWRRRLARDEVVRPLRRLAPAARRLHAAGVVHLHAHFAARAALDAMRLGALLGIPYSVMTHGYDIFSLPSNLRDIVFEVDVAAQESRAFNPMTETADILFYEPLEDSYRQSRVLDLFKRLPVRMALFRIFAHDETHRRELIKAANEVLGLTA